MVKLEWEGIDQSHERAKVFGGWIVKSSVDVLVSMHEDQPPTQGYEWRESMVFVPDPNHEWGNEPEEVMQEGERDPTNPHEFKHIECPSCSSRNLACEYKGNKPAKEYCMDCKTVIRAYTNKRATPPRVFHNLK